MVVIILSLAMITITTSVYLLTHQKIISPCMLFMVPFSISSFWLIMNISRWSVELSYHTFFVIISGSISALFGMLLGTHKWKLHKKNSMNLNGFKRYSSKEELSSSFFAIYSIIELLISYMCLKKIRSVVHRYGVYGSLSYEIYKYRNLGMYTTESTSLGKWLDWAYLFNMASGYILAYIIAYRIKNRKKLGIYLLLSMLASLMTGLIKGGRQSAIQIIFAGIVYFLIIFFDGKKTRRLPLKKMVKIIVIILLLLVSFQTLGTILGRTVQADFMQYLAVYLCGGIRNLNEWLKVPHELPDLFGKSTFHHLYTYFGRKFNRPEWIYNYDLPYLSANGKNSGNIYTMFYGCIYDFGYIGLVVMPFIMGFITQKIYRKTQKVNYSSERNICFYTILYGYFSYNLVFSFFGNKFYSGIMQISFFKLVLFWAILIWVINKVKQPFC